MFVVLQNTKSFLIHLRNVFTAFHRVVYMLQCDRTYAGHCNTLPNVLAGVPSLLPSCRFKDCFSMYGRR